MKQIFTAFLFAFAMTCVFAQNHAIKFNGSQGHLVFNHDSDFNIGLGFTVEAWINARTWKSEAWAGSILTKDKQDPDSGFAFRAGKNGTLSFVMSVNSVWNEVVSPEILKTNQWFHTAAVYRAGNITLYINGEEVASGAVSNGSTTSNTQPLSIGESSGFPGRVFDGAIDDLRVWDLARTENEIHANQMVALSGNEPGLIAYFPMNEGQGFKTTSIVNDIEAEFRNGLTANAWVDGFFVPVKDIGVTKIISPDEVNIFKRPVRVRVSVKNFEGEVASNFPIEIIRNGVSVLTETFDGSLAPGEEAEFTFEKVLDIRDANTNQITVRTKDPDDPNTLNNSASYRYERSNDGNIINILNAEQHNFGNAGQNRFTTKLLPQNMEDYTQLLLHISVECPTTGCDPWDQAAKVIVIRDDQEYEIARYVTPYRKACGPWTVDVTDFKTLLSGEVHFKSFVQVWGPSGWLVNLDLEMIEGTSDLPFQKLTTLWAEDRWVYGDPGIEDDLEEKEIGLHTNTKSVRQRMTISGHGQGNTNNAAEFSPKTHKFILNGTLLADHFLWKNDCAQNTCANQFGTWEGSRAGWCPGQAVEPVTHNLTGHVNAGENITLDYALEEYTNLLNTGYNNGGHTEPFYRIWSYVIEESDERYAAYSNIMAESISVETNGDVENPSFDKVSMTVRNTGTEAMTDPTFTYYVNGEVMIADQVSVTIEPGTQYIHEFSTVMGFEAGEHHDIFGLVVTNSDENLSDDAIYNFLDADLTTSTKNVQFKPLHIYPNPTTGFVTLEVPDAIIGSVLEVLDINGRILRRQVIQSSKELIDVSNSPGSVFFKIVNKEGKRYYQKVVVN